MRVNIPGAITAVAVVVLASVITLSLFKGLKEPELAHLPPSVLNAVDYLFKSSTLEQPPRGRDCTAYGVEFDSWLKSVGTIRQEEIPGKVSAVINACMNSPKSWNDSAQAQADAKRIRDSLSRADIPQKGIQHLVGRTDAYVQPTPADAPYPLVSIEIARVLADALDQIGNERTANQERDRHKVQWGIIASFLIVGAAAWAASSARVPDEGKKVAYALIAAVAGFWLGK